MKTKIGILVLALSTTFFTVQAQRRVVTARATNYDISDNLDLDAVASIFGDSENLEDFEYRLNDPDNRISNLDLNQDGYIDYLRVLENSSDRNSLVVVQAVLDQDVYQDVATIEIERVSNGNLRVQIVGDAYIYGSNYIIEPVFVRTPLIFSFFWGPRYHVYRSPYYWNYYPRWYSYYRPYPTFRYHRHIHSHINWHNSYHRASSRQIHFSGENYNHIRRSDYASRYPDRAFTNRHQGLSNRNELIEKRPGNTVNRQRSYNIPKSNSRQYQGTGNSSPGRTDRQRDVYENRRPGSGNQSGSYQPGSRENRSSNPEYRSGSSDSNRSKVQRKSEYKNESTGKPSVSRSQSSSTPSRSSGKVESGRSSSAPREKSVSGSRSRSNSEARQSSRSTHKSTPNKKEEKKETENGRRR